VSFFARHTFSLIATTTCALFLCLVLWGYHNSLAVDLASPSHPTHHHPIITAYHTLPETPQMAYTLAHTLAQHPIQKIAYAILLSLKPQNTYITPYLHHTQFGAVKSLSKAAQYYFGVSAQELSLGETLLLLKLAHTPNLPITDPIVALQHRDSLLLALRNNNTITAAQYQKEHQKALALAADHRPIN